MLSAHSFPLTPDELAVWLHKQEAAGGPPLADFVPRLIARLKEEGPPSKPE